MREQLERDYYALMDGLIQPRAGRIPGARWFRPTETGIVHSDPDCPAIRTLTGAEDARSSLHGLYEMDPNSREAWEWLHTKLHFPTNYVPELRAGWYRRDEAPDWYYPTMDEEEFAEYTDQVDDALTPSEWGHRKYSHTYEAESWRSCRRCGTSAAAPATCPKCWLTSCDCD